jgi:dTMP kinase
MKEIELLFTIAKAILENKGLKNDMDYPPIFSFEGLPGAGKTTQIIKTSNDLEKKYGKSYYIDLPTDSPIGKILKMVYSDLEQWDKIRNEAPWINPLFLSIDLQLALQKAKEEGAGFVLMSRGILSTYYYNIDTYLKKYNEFDEAWDKISNDLRGFARPKAIVFFEVPVEEAHQRVLKRNRGPLREMDQIKKMESDRILLNQYINLLKDELPVHYIDANADQDVVTDRIEEVLNMYLEKHKC